MNTAAKLATFPANNASGLGLLRLIFTVPRWWAIRIVILLLTAGLLEGIGLATMLPLIGLMAGAQDGVSSSAGPIGPILVWIGDLFDRKAGPGLLLALIAALFWLKGGAIVAARADTATLMARFARDLRAMLLDSLAHARWSYFGTKPTGDLANAMTVEVTRTGSVLSLCFEMVAAAMQVTIYLGLAALVSWQLTAAGIVASLTLWLILYRFVRMARRARPHAKPVLSRSVAPPCRPARRHQGDQSHGSRGPLYAIVDEGERKSLPRLAPKRAEQHVPAGTGGAAADYHDGRSGYCRIGMARRGVCRTGGDGAGVVPNGYDVAESAIAVPVSCLP